MERTKGKKAGNGSHRAEEAKDGGLCISNHSNQISKVYVLVGNS